ncbi:alpha/beta fold hydrolase [Phycicoccus duodecadis]|uniref:Haloacetate dehalogenase n=1 Tax=Phycicoccus duodecadis TaxID=173053 RepID=A0A2N3YLF4_9MICO|nr:alpha/beta hydrolase [Phycicoccus duodecadis]PKW27683.1 haloacetate dehalogenase [Phycicoccus duodecadis]
MTGADETTDLDVGDARIRVRRRGSGSPVLLLHGYPQTHRMWDEVAAALAERHEVITPDLRGYGDSSAPDGGPEHAGYSKRAMAADVVAVMAALGHERFAVAGHDRGGRVAHRLALDHPQALTRLAVLDIAPTLHMVENTDRQLAYGYYHWFFLAQPDGLPERLIGADPGWFLREKLRRWSAPGTVFDEERLAEYVRCFSRPEVVHASCEDYRAALGVDLDHDRASRDAGERVGCPLLVLWGEAGFVARSYDVVDVWRRYADDVRGRTVPGGHFCPEESPAEVTAALAGFFAVDGAAG